MREHSDDRFPCKQKGEMATREGNRILGACHYLAEQNKNKALLLIIKNMPMKSYGCSSQL